MMRALLIALLLLACAPCAFAARPAEVLADPAQEARAEQLQKELRCLVCQGESLDESNAPLAADLRRLVREHIRAGESDDQIKAFLVARYGDFILMKPPFEADTYALWFAPLAVLILGGGIAIWVVRRASARAPSDPA